MNKKSKNAFLEYNETASPFHLNISFKIWIIEFVGHANDGLAIILVLYRFLASGCRKIGLMCGCYTFRVMMEKFTKVCGDWMWLWVWGVLRSVYGRLIKTNWNKVCQEIFFSFFFCLFWNCYLSTILVVFFMRLCGKGAVFKFV